MGATTFAALLEDKGNKVINPLEWRKYNAIVSLYGFYGGIYIQVCHASVNPMFPLPLSFAKHTLTLLASAAEDRSCGCWGMCLHGWFISQRFMDLCYGQES